MTKERIDLLHRRFLENTCKCHVLENVKNSVVSGPEEMNVPQQGCPFSMYCYLLVQGGKREDI